MPGPLELFEKTDPVTADFTYIRWLGDHKEIEKITTVWNKTVVDRTAELQSWVSGTTTPSNENCLDGLSLTQT
jgi:hypothetical protein